MRKVNYGLIRQLEEEQVQELTAQRQKEWDERKDTHKGAAPILAPPKFRTGDSLRVHLRVREGNRERIQVFEGVVIRHQKGLLSERCTVRKISNGVGVERVFLVHSPRIEKIEVVRLGKVRRARLYYLRTRIGTRATRIKERGRL